MQNRTTATHHHHYYFKTNSLKQTNKFPSHSTTTSCSCRVEQQQKFGRIQRFNESMDTFMEWEDISFCKNCYCNNEGISIHLQRGGKLMFYPRIINESERKEISIFMDKWEYYRQYRTNGCKESRVHILLSSHGENNHDDTIMNKDNVGHGYKYHNVSMKALALSKAPPIEKIATKLGAKWDIPNNDWNIGVQLIIYQGGKGNIGWHADDTQGEQIIATVVIDTDPRRLVLVRPKKKEKERYENGDENIELLVRRGDGYTMDRKSIYRLYVIIILYHFLKLHTTLFTTINKKCFDS